MDAFIKDQPCCLLHVLFFFCVCGLFSSFVLVQMDALNHVRQRQLRDVVMFFMEDSKSDPVQPTASSSSSSGRENTATTTGSNGRVKKEESKQRPRYGMLFARIVQYITLQYIQARFS